MLWRIDDIPFSAYGSGAYYEHYVWANPAVRIFKCLRDLAGSPTHRRGEYIIHNGFGTNSDMYPNLDKLTAQAVLIELLGVKVKEYVVTIETPKPNVVVTFGTFATDRKDAIEYAKRTHRARFLSGEYKRVKGARLRPVTKGVTT